MAIKGLDTTSNVTKILDTIKRGMRTKSWTV